MTRYEKQRKIKQTKTFTDTKVCTNKCPHIGTGAQSTLGRHFSQKYRPMYENINKMSEFYTTFVRKKLTKFPNFP